MKLAHAITVADLRGLARKNLPKAVFEFVDGGAHDERTLSANTRDLAQIGLAPRVLTDVSRRSQAAEILGQAFSSPLMLGPTGLAGLLWPDGDIVTARATAVPVLLLPEHQLELLHRTGRTAWSERLLVSALYPA